MRGLTGKRFIVAGGASGIGAATAIRLAQEGAAVLVGDINRDALALTIDRITSVGGLAKGCHFDLADFDSAQSLARACFDAYGRIDGLANVGADLSQPSSWGELDLLETTEEQWMGQFRCNLMGYTRTTRAVLPYLLEGRGGAIVNVSSLAVYAGERVRPAYASVKAGIHALTRHVARRWGSDNIRCNCIAPGLVLSETLRDKMPPAVKDKLVETIALRRAGEPAELAAAIAFLLSDDGAWVTGQVWSVNGGQVFRD